MQENRKGRSNFNAKYCQWLVIYVYLLTSLFLAQFPGRIVDNQEDAHEMLIFLLGKLEPPIPKRTDQNTPKNVQPTEIDRIFGGKICSRSKPINQSFNIAFF